MTAARSPSVHVGCCGWPASRAAYFRRHDAVEVQTSFYNLPKPETAARWREEAPKGFAYAMKAWQLITHPGTSPTYRKLTAKLSPRALLRCGHFRDTEEVTDAWERTAAVARELAARFVVFQTPPSFSPGPDRLRDMYRFFKRLRRGEATLIWEPRGPAWTVKLIRRVCGDLGLVPGGDPLGGLPAELVEAPGPAVRYWRLHGPVERGRVEYRHAYGEAELRRLASLATGRAAWVFFNNTVMWEDAARFGRLVGR